jgi:c-di-GMP-binding flagellar brake protein YcgR
MTALPHPGAASHRKRGLVPGVKLNIEYTTARRSETTVTTVEEVLDDRIGILVPMVQRAYRPMPVGTSVCATFQFRGKTWQFNSEVIAHDPEQRVDYLAAPRELHSTDRRHAFRLQTALRPECIFRLVVDPDRSDEDAVRFDGAVVDLSEGGLCLSTRAHVDLGERLGIELKLPEGGTLLARLRVITVEEPADGRMNRRLHCQFIGIRDGDRDRIARFLMRRQQEMRRRGQL